jgi:hypothetical protein
MKAMTAGLACALAAAGSAALADEYNFKTPSQNINCAYYDFNGTPEVRCDIRDYTPTGHKRPADCDLEWGDSFVIGPDAESGSPICHGDTVISPDAETLAYGESFARGGIVCSSAKTGLSCENKKGHGFRLSKARQEVF